MVIGSLIPGPRSYATAANGPKNKKPQKVKLDFPALATPVAKSNINQAKIAESTHNNKGNTEKYNNKKIKDMARKSTTTSRYVTTNGVPWVDLKRSIEQKIKAPKLHTIKSRTGLILFPGNEETRRALDRTSNLKEVKPLVPRIMARGVESALDPTEIPWAIVHQNEELGLSEKDQENIRPMYKLGPRGEHTTNWVLEVLPPTAQKLEGKKAYIGMMRCKLTLWDKSPQCFKCQGFGHTSAKCTKESPTCRNCAGAHDSRTCKEEVVMCANCKGPHKASSAACRARSQATKNLLRRTDFGQQ
ncbi:Uncharacterized protein FWK35_00033701 [Aphis craccivora]|uniref:CCHC-type domain-containing protein n=1 Tax=Aphis craccivora TaxID=307492 RepID=A0A6G0W0U9_APHCR|nr:Uncharacterized protein FWK35_00033701 [Aphis craccivora]